MIRCFLLVCLSLGIGLRAQPLEQVREAERQWFEASGNADSNSIAELLDESFRGITFDGKVWDNKRSLVAN
jgi:hypothetical protein